MTPSTTSPRPGTKIASFPAFDVLEPRRTKDGAAIVTADMDVRIAFTSGSTFAWWPCRFGSVVSYALECGEDPVAAIDDARARGHALVWCNRQATVISGSPLLRSAYAGLRLGETVKFEGVTYTLEEAPNANVSLRRVEG